MKKLNILIFLLILLLVIVIIGIFKYPIFTKDNGDNLQDIVVEDTNEAIEQTDNATDTPTIPLDNNEDKDLNKDDLIINDSQFKIAKIEEGYTWTYYYENNFIDNFVIYRGLEEEPYIYDLQNNGNYILDIESDYRNIYYIDDNYVYAVNDSNLEDYAIPHFLVYDYKKSKSSIYSIDLEGLKYGDYDHFAYNDGYTYFLITSYNNKDGLLIVNQDEIVNFIQIDNLEIANSSILKKDNSIYIKANTTDYYLLNDNIIKVIDEDEKAKVLSTSSDENDENLSLFHEENTVYHKDENNKKTPIISVNDDGIMGMKIIQVKDIQYLILICDRKTYILQVENGK